MEQISIGYGAIALPDEALATPSRSHSGIVRLDIALRGSTRDFLDAPAPDPRKRADEFHAWMQARVDFGGFPYAKTLLGNPRPVSTLRLADGREISGLNFSSQDYLNLSTHSCVTEVAIEAIRQFGLHSAGSTALAGNCALSTELEIAIAELVHTEYVSLFPTGWAAGFGAVKALIRPTDHVVIDQLAHNCLLEGAAAATRNVHIQRHLDIEHARRLLTRIRAKDCLNGILLVTEGVFSMNSDSPDIRAMQALAAEYDAVLLVDVAHDLGCMGPGGTGQIGIQGMLGQVDLVMGSFSKSFASNGGFVASNRPAVKEYLRFYASPNTFSNALSPVQVATILKSTRIIQSSEGETRRKALMNAIHALRTALELRGRIVLGSPSPIVPVHVGTDAVARLACGVMAERGLITNLVEYPAVSLNTARLRLQVMSEHSAFDCKLAAEIADASVKHANDTVFGH
ncbi:aminotransferase class I/II-fold pyridoxal phosphate-dependent enzyme [Cupriavidus basilensis]|uniref:Aminotransferase class I/II-fold pyridoxal phosphate-dependent enzyme n=1 Tax=Cupriavidus basilensis TaxID=68895 RepID=A0ABT6ARF1_9BURK|nr:aminotransferase class I/II-fold pyridoxal phosphate-dependent enzyme [Cupriavidus basilensis]MDF3835199.1 aminotransferase class I/II-fold pyridoxal phosphate-dependent enzyme [Cupriavidus basilensis]